MIFEYLCITAYYTVPFPRKNASICCICPVPERVCCVPILSPSLYRGICCASQTLRKARYRWKFRYASMIQRIPFQFCSEMSQVSNPSALSSFSSWSRHGMSDWSRGIDVNVCNVAALGGADYAPLRIRALSEASCDGLELMLLSRRCTSTITILKAIWKPTHPLSPTYTERQYRKTWTFQWQCILLELQICIYNYNIHLINRYFFSRRHVIHSFSQRAAARQFEYVLTQQGI